MLILRFISSNATPDHHYMFTLWMLTNRITAHTMVKGTNIHTLQVSKLRKISKQIESKCIAATHSSGVQFTHQEGYWFTIAISETDKDEHINAHLRRTTPWIYALQTVTNTRMNPLLCDSRQTGRTNMENSNFKAILQNPISTTICWTERHELVMMMMIIVLSRTDTNYNHFYMAI